MRDSIKVSGGGERNAGHEERQREREKHFPELGFSEFPPATGFPAKQWRVSEEEEGGEDGEGGAPELSFDCRQPRRRKMGGHFLPRTGCHVL